LRWKIRPSDPESVRKLADALSSLPFLPRTLLSPRWAKLLLLRGIDSAEAAAVFLSPSLIHLHSPYLMTGMQLAIDRLDAAIERKEGILVYGDYDVDGTRRLLS